jgi:segregation and condensation protein B
VSRKNRSRKKDEQQQPAPVAPQGADAQGVDATAAAPGDETLVDASEGQVAEAEAAEIVEAVEADVTEIVEVEIDIVDVVTVESVDAEAEAEEDSEAGAEDDVAVEVFSVDGNGAGGEAEPVDASEEQLAVRDTASYDHLKPIIEALIFASPEPLTPKTLFKLLESEPKEDVETALALLKQDYDRPGGLQLVEVAGGYQIVTRPELHEYVRRLFHERTSQKLSVQALETLAVIAYRQPVTAPEITEIRGVNTSGVLNTLVDRKLVKIVGRKDVVGRPFMYATTRDFLDKFGLNDISDLPKVEDLADVLGFEPPSLDSGEPEATTLAFDFDDPGEPRSSHEASAPASEEDASVEASGSTGTTEITEPAESSEPPTPAEAHDAHDARDTHETDEPIAPVDDAPSESPHAVSADAVPADPTEHESPRDEDEYP